MVSFKLRRFLLSENIFLKKKLFLKKKRIWVHDINKKRKVFGEFHHLYNQLRHFPEKFYEYTRMEVETFDYILNEIKSDIGKKTTNWREPISPQERLFVTLRYLATGISLRSLAFSFRIGESTLRSIVMETSVAIWGNLQNTHMPIPTKNDFIRTAKDFYEKCNFPNCIGAIDGKHCRIKCPPHSGSDYFNYKKYFSIVLQGVADSNCKFLFIEVGNKGSQSDGGTFAASNLLSCIKNNKLDIPLSKNLPNCNEKTPFVFVADEAYPLTSYLMRPYPRRVLNEKSSFFNERLSSARRCVECAFGILSEKWRLLKREIDTSTERATILIKTMCLLHNIIIDIENIDDYHYTYDPDEYNNNDTLERAIRSQNRAKQEAKNIRDRFSTYFDSVRKNENL